MQKDRFYFVSTKYGFLTPHPQKLIPR